MVTTHNPRHIEIIKNLYYNNKLVGYEVKMSRNGKETLYEVPLIVLETAVEDFHLTVISQYAINEKLESTGDGRLKQVCGDSRRELTYSIIAKNVGYDFLASNDVYLKNLFNKVNKIVFKGELKTPVVITYVNGNIVDALEKEVSVKKIENRYFEIIIADDGKRTSGTLEGTIVKAIIRTIYTGTSPKEVQGYHTFIQTINSRFPQLKIATF